MSSAVRAVVDPDAPVPSCPDWVARDLIRHLGGVHRWATGYVAEARPEVRPEGLDEVVGRWPERRRAGRLVRGGVAGARRCARGGAAGPAVLDVHAGAVAAGVLEPAPGARDRHPPRRHRAGGRPSPVELAPFTPAFAADGVDELLTCFVPRALDGLRAERAGHASSSAAPTTTPPGRSASGPTASRWPPARLGRGRESPAAGRARCGAPRAIVPGAVEPRSAASDSDRGRPRGPRRARRGAAVALDLREESSRPGGFSLGVRPA